MVYITICRVSEPIVTFEISNAAIRCLWPQHLECSVVLTENDRKFPWLCWPLKEHGRILIIYVFIVCCLELPFHGEIKI